MTIPSEFYDDADGRGTVRVKFFVKIFPKENGIVNLKVNLFGDGVRGFGFFTEAMTSSSTKEFHVEFLLTKGIGNTDRFVCINGIPSQDLHSWSDTGAVEVEWADFPTTVSRLKFSTSAGTQRADVRISGLTAEMCILND
ncbi:hypothetical protein OKW96_09925 [Sphingobacterium sp. KU25419]|nr:hypothetical protein OKW96_09925 [Sphingobacterium sp. KU25419]